VSQGRRTGASELHCVGRKHFFVLVYMLDDGVLVDGAEY
jgi:hypothetical protein